MRKSLNAVLCVDTTRTFIKLSLKVSHNRGSEQGRNGRLFLITVRLSPCSLMATNAAGENTGNSAKFNMGANATSPQKMAFGMCALVCVFSVFWQGVWWVLVPADRNTHWICKYYMSRFQWKNIIWVAKGQQDLKCKEFWHWLNPKVHYSSLYRLNQQTDHCVYLRRGAGSFTMLSNSLLKYAHIWWQCPSREKLEWDIQWCQNAHFIAAWYSFSKGLKCFPLQAKYVLCWWVPSFCSSEDDQLSFHLKNEPPNQCTACDAVWFVLDLLGNECRFVENVETFSKEFLLTWHGTAESAD